MYEAHDRLSSNHHHRHHGLRLVSSTTIATASPETEGSNPPAIDPHDLPQPPARWTDDSGNLLGGLMAAGLVVVVAILYCAMFTVIFARAQLVPLIW